MKNALKHRNSFKTLNEIDLAKLKKIKKILNQI